MRGVVVDAPRLASCSRIGARWRSVDLTEGAHPEEGVVHGGHGFDGQPPRRSSRGPVLGAVLGAGAGFVVGAVVYVLVSPALERSSGILRELQGLLWNLVPFLTVVGVLAGLLLARRRRRR
jgi:hypothetical protein